MQFNSLQFAVFFPIACAVYFIVPRKLRALWLLVCSYCFYMSWSPRYALLLAASTLATYGAGLALGRGVIETPEALGVTLRPQRTVRDRIVLAACLLFNLAILGVFKYGNMFLATIGSSRTLHFLLPVGISFYTFQALGYLLDVYRGDVAPERSLIRYALFVSFFPQLVAGPIERSKNLLPQVRSIEDLRLWNARRVTEGAILMVWGFFLKMVISDRAAILVDNVWAQPDAFGRKALLLASLLFTLQIYCDFGGYSMIAIGAARILGFRLMENFRAPYLACSIREFWASWHISLSTWFRDYLYIPLGGNRKGRLRRGVNLLITFLVSGLWHGADWSFVLWGGIHGAGQLVENALTRRKAPASPDVDATGAKGKAFASLARGALKFVRWGLTLAFVNFAWIFFRAPNIASAFAFLKRLALGGPAAAPLEGTQAVLGLDGIEFAVLGAACLALLAFDLIRKRRGEMPDEFLLGRRLSTEWAVLIALIAGIFVFGEYGPTFDPKAFIYFQF
ncbi:MAG: MBOAT family protein [Clostridia bacterium]|nr:MBOAT family protein [Clostridia bacterium]